MYKYFKYQVVLHLIIFVWGFTAILGVYIQTDAFILVWYRVLIAFASLFLFLLIFRKKYWITSKKDLLSVLGVGVLVALHWLTFYLSIKVSTASLAIICLSTTTIHVAWLEPIIMKRKPIKSEIVLGLIIIGGIFLTTQHQTSSQQLLGIIYGLIAALFAALFATFNAKLIHTIPASKITLYEMFSATIIMTIILAFFGDLTLQKLQISNSDFLLLLFLGMVCTSIAFLVTVEITRFLGAFTVTLSINMEPIYTLILAAVLLQEYQELSLTFYFGAAIIVAAVFGNALLKAKRRRKLRAKELMD